MQARNLIKVNFKKLGEFNTSIFNDLKESLKEFTIGFIGAI